MTAFTHRGAVRADNEDSIAVGDWIRSESMAVPVLLERALDSPLICLVADGMGGHAAGEVASRTVAEHLAARATQATDAAAIAALLRDANGALFELMGERPAWYGMGTTVAGVAVAPAGVLVFNVGDSRVYRIEAGALVQLSTDDTPGPKRPDGRTAVYTSSIISQVLGGYEPDNPDGQLDPHVLSEPPAERARYLICSDGLTDLVDPAEIEGLLDGDDDASVRALFETAMAAGGGDNVSLILLRIERAPPTP
jgi:serine/threonine protein phosphatase PrpC